MSGEISIWRIASQASTWKANDLSGWDSAPAPERAENRFAATRAWGDAWLLGLDSLLAELPPVIVPEETNLLLNPRGVWLFWGRRLRRRRLGAGSQDWISSTASSASWPAAVRRAPSSRAVPRMWPAKMSRFTLRLGSWK